MSTESDRRWDAEQERAADDRTARFNAEHGHLPGCEFVVDDWVCHLWCKRED